MRTAYHPESVAATSPLPRELGQVWTYAAVLAIVSGGFVYAMTQEVGFTILALGVCLVGALGASLKVWLTVPPQGR